VVYEADEQGQRGLERQDQGKNISLYTIEIAAMWMASGWIIGGKCNEKRAFWIWVGCWRNENSRILLAWKGEKKWQPCK